MKHLDFPITASAARLHAREFEAQDQCDNAATAYVTGAESAPSRAGAGLLHTGHPDHGRKASAWVSARSLLRWTLVCVALALAAAIVLSWLVRPDLARVKWVDSQASLGLQPVSEAVLRLC